MISRRTLLQTLATLPALAAKRDGSPQVSFGTGTYGMKAMKPQDALQTLAEIGYDVVELCVISGWPSDPATMSQDDRRTLRKSLNDSGLGLPAMLESLPYNKAPEKREHNLERLKMAVALANELVPSKPPVVETVLGGKGDDWESRKSELAEELAKWARVAEDAKVTVCFKPHAGQTINSPERTKWLLDQVRSPWIRIVYDYSHFFLEGFPLASSLKELLPYTAFISVKDSVGAPDNHRFLLPGDGKTDYLEYFRLLRQMHYAGSVIVEVSAMIHQQPGYQPVPTAKLCYQRLAPLFEQAGLSRPAHSRRS